jgi:hypothetical protein
MDDSTRRLMTAQADAYEQAVNAAEKVKEIVTGFDGKVMNKRFHDTVRAIGNTSDDQSTGFWVRSSLQPPYTNANVLELDIYLIPDPAYITTQDHPSVSYIPEKQIRIVPRHCYPELVGNDKRIDAERICAAIDEKAGANRAAAAALRDPGLEGRVDGYKDKAAYLIARLSHLYGKVLDDIPNPVIDRLGLRLDTYNITKDWSTECKVRKYEREFALNEVAQAQETGDKNGTVPQRTARLDDEAADARAAAGVPSNTKQTMKEGR